MIVRASVVSSLRYEMGPPPGGMAAILARTASEWTIVEALNRSIPSRPAMGSVSVEASTAGSAARTDPTVGVAGRPIRSGSPGMACVAAGMVGALIRRGW